MLITIRRHTFSPRNETDAEHKGEGCPDQNELAGPPYLAVLRKRRLMAVEDTISFESAGDFTLKGISRDRQARLIHPPFRRSIFRFLAPRGLS